MGKMTVYGPGGYDPTKPNDNVVALEDVADPPPEAVARDTLQQLAAQALAANRALLAIASPSNAQVVAQVKALTRQANGLIRLVLGQLDGTD